MLKNLNPKELNNRSSKSENIEDSQDENDEEPLCSFDISLNNGKKASLVIFEEDNYGKKVNDFCRKYKISPQDEKVLLKKVKEELEINTNIDNDNNIIKNDNKPIERFNNNINNNNNYNNMIKNNIKPYL